MAQVGQLWYSEIHGYHFNIVVFSDFWRHQTDVIDFIFQTLGLHSGAVDKTEDPWSKLSLGVNEYVFANGSLHFFLHLIKFVNP